MPEHINVDPGALATYAKGGPDRAGAITQAIGELPQQRPAELLGALLHGNQSLVNDTRAAAQAGADCFTALGDLAGAAGGTARETDTFSSGLLGQGGDVMSA